MHLFLVLQNAIDNGYGNADILIIRADIYNLSKKGEKTASPNIRFSHRLLARIGDSMMKIAVNRMEFE